MTCLDTTFLVDWLRGNEKARMKYDDLLRVDEGEVQQLSVSIVTVYELEKRAKLSKNPARDLKLVRDLFSELRI